MAESTNVVIYHNPECGTSRNVLAIIEAAGYRPTLTEYLKTGWTRRQLLGLFAAAALSDEIPTVPLAVVAPCDEQTRSDILTARRRSSVWW